MQVDLLYSDYTVDMTAINQDDLIALKVENSSQKTLRMALVLSKREDKNHTLVKVEMLYGRGYDSSNKWSAGGDDSNVWINSCAIAYANSMRLNDQKFSPVIFHDTIGHRLSGESKRQPHVQGGCLNAVRVSPFFCSLRRV